MAHENPDLRPEILPLLKAGGLSQFEEGEAAEKMGEALDAAHEALTKLQADKVFETIVNKAVLTNYKPGDARKIAMAFKSLTQGVTELRAQLRKSWDIEDY
jgi:hypothetical protein